MHSATFKYDAKVRCFSGAAIKCSIEVLQCKVALSAVLVIDLRTVQLSNMMQNIECDVSLAAELSLVAMEYRGAAVHCSGGED